MNEDLTSEDLSTPPTVKPTVESIPATAFSFTFQVPSAPLFNLKRDQSHIDVPASTSNSPSTGSPAKKRARVDINASVNNSPIVFAPLSPPITCGGSDLEVEEDNVEETVPTRVVTPPVVSRPKSKITTKITAFWKIATDAEKEETNQREFQVLRDNFEETAADIADEKRRKLTRVRTQARERQQTHRNRSKERKLEAGWVPGIKRVMAFYTT